MKIYVPEFNTNNCLVIRNGDVIRVYESRPTTNSDVNYIDYYIGNHYIDISGTQHFATTSSIPTCLNTNRITTNNFYRFDLVDILISFFILAIVCFYFPYKIFSRMFGRWLKW